jgi:hypothetical protein
VKYAWIEKHRRIYSTTMMCELLSVSRSGLNAARVRAPSKRARDDEQLVEQVRDCQRKHRGRYGRRRMTTEVSEAQGRPVNHKRVARVMLRVLDRNPDEVFLIEGHTDAVGGDVDNLSLSDRRAEAVAGILSETFGVPPENLVTQGYGKQYLKIDTPAPERLNRRVAIRRITPLMSER